MVAVPPLGDVMQERRHEKRPPRIDFRHHRRCHRGRLRQTSAFDLMQDADHLDGMLVDGEAVVHVELHHRDDLAEIGQEPAENAAFVHQSQDPFRIVLRGQDGEKFRCRLRVVPCRLAKGVEPAGDPLQRLRVHIGILFEGQTEDLQHPSGRSRNIRSGSRLTLPARMAKWPNA